MSTERTRPMLSCWRLEKRVLGPQGGAWIRHLLPYIFSSPLFRNGGHITPTLYSEYEDLKKQYGMEIAKKIIRFRLSHLPELLAVAEEEDLLQDSQCREVEAFDVFHDATLYETTKAQLSAYRKDLPEESINYRTYEGFECIKVG